MIMMLRVQRERLEHELGDAPGEYLARYGLTPERLRRGSHDVVVMHPGPMNRGVEIDSAVADDPQRSLIRLQVEMGVAMRMACLDCWFPETPLSARRSGPARRPRPSARSSFRPDRRSDTHRFFAWSALSKPRTDKR